jgi:exodeoxyribonuclease VII large subunit
MLLQNDLPLKVPKHEKDDAKRLGVRPCYVEEKFSHWFVPANKNVMPFKQWWPDDFKKQMIAEGIIEPENEIQEPIESHSLSDVLKRVKNVVTESFKKPVWIRAEIINISTKGHTYLEISDYDGAGAENAKARGMIWSSDNEIIRNFREKTGLDLKAGMKILFQAKIEFSEKFGLSLVIINIDPNFTLGDMEMKVASIRKRLIDSNIYDINKQKKRPYDFFKVVVISPQDAAGLGDFRTQADALEQHGLCRFRYLSATFSGNDCTKSIVTALQQASRFGPQIDAVVIIRGGGDKAGLYALNEYEIAEAVCNFPCPVIVGIGHERDNTLLDEVANIRCATPSLVIGYISSTIVKNAQECKNNMLIISKTAQETISRARAEVNQVYGEIREMALQTTSRARNECDMLMTQIHYNAKGILSNARNEIKLLMQEIFTNNPFNVLERGYAIVREQDGTVLTTKESAKGKSVTITFKDGTSTATITD